VSVLVANTGAGGGWGNGQLRGGVHVSGNVRDILLASTATGQQIIICTQAAAGSGCIGAGGGNNQRRTVIREDRTVVPNKVYVDRQCFTSWVAPAAPTCSAGVGATWKLDPYLPATVGHQELDGSFTPDQQTDHGVLFVTGAIGLQGTEYGLRQCPSTGVYAVDCPGTTGAVFNNALDPLVGSRWTVVADGNIFITGHLVLQRDPRGADVPEPIFTEPIPGVGDDLDVQNVLGVVSWSGGIRLSSWLGQANLLARYPAIDNQNLYLQGMFMAANLPNAAAPVGQLSFDDSGGAYRGQARLLGGVVQKTMGTLGSPGTPGTGYARDWVYDERFRHRGMSPPLFPGFPRFSATGGPGIDDYTFRAGRF
jgi:hypothetical protein